MKCLSVLVGSAVMVIASPAQTFTNLVNFSSVGECGPYMMSMLQGTDGNLYGTALAGGSENEGTVFRLTPAGALSTLYSFVSGGIDPIYSLDLANDGNLYGATWYGGPNNVGTIFTVTVDGRLTTLYESASTVGIVNALVQGVDGEFYGTGCIPNSATPTPCLAYGSGSAFKMTPAGALTMLHTFTSGTDGWGPSALIQATDGDFYGTTYGGGSGCCGTIFKITSTGALTTLYNFNGPDGNGPTAALAQVVGLIGPGEVFYGTTFSGGADGYGTVFEITPDGALTTLHSFDNSDGANPFAPLVQGTDGKFYGTTLNGGSANLGTIFEITPKGKFTLLHTFTGPDGLRPYGGLVQATNGIFYGTTNQGGGGGCGNAFSLDPGLGPFVKTVPHSGKLGSAVRLLGYNLTGATNVRFNGTVADFAVVSPTQILARVPAAATTGKIQVTIPTGILSSGGPFLVIP